MIYVCQTTRRHGSEDLILRLYWWIWIVICTVTLKLVEPLCVPCLYIRECFVRFMNQKTAHLCIRANTQYYSATTCFGSLQPQTLPFTIYNCIYLTSSKLHKLKLFLLYFDNNIIWFVLTIKRAKGNQT